MGGDLPDPGAFGAAFQDFIEAMTRAATRPDSAVATRVREHLGADPATLPPTSARFSTADHPNLQLALEAVLPDAELLGFRIGHGFMPPGLTAITGGEDVGTAIHEGPVQYADVEIGDGRVLRCVASGLMLARQGDAPVALLVSRAEQPFGPPGLRLEGISPDGEAVSALLRRLREAMRERNVFRGKVISLHHEHHDETVRVVYHDVPHVPRDGVVLPPGTLERLERQALGIAEQAGALRAGGRHLKRGVLLHGPPGTGKTLSVSYLIGAMPGRTTVVLTGRGLGLIEQALSIARDLAPATVVFEDIDLVAAERTFAVGDNGLLFELLNQMEGLQDDADLLFLLTTNRPDLVEPALAARPGRIDLALEVPLPDADARLRLVRLYAGDAELDEESMRDVAARTEGVSGAFVRELMRQAALRAALAGAARPSGDDVRATLDELLDERSALTRRLLGEPGPDGEAGPPAGMVRAMYAAGLPMPVDLDDDELD